MKLKTREEILAMDLPIMKHWITKTVFVDGYEKAQSDIADQATKGFPEYYYTRVNPMRDLEKYPVTEFEKQDTNYLSHLTTWQASQTLQQNQIEEAEKAINDLLDASAQYCDVSENDEPNYIQEMCNWARNYQRKYMNKSGEK